MMPLCKRSAAFKRWPNCGSTCKSALEQDALTQSEENLETAILNAILETTEVDLPETLIEQETTQLLAQSLQALRQEGIKPGELRKFLSELPPETLNQLKERHRPEAIDRLRRTLGP
jgi:trigger factor